MCKWNGARDVVVMRRECAVRDANDAVKAALWCDRVLPEMANDQDTCGVCGFADGPVDNGICACCRQDMGIG